MDEDRRRSARLASERSAESTTNSATHAPEHRSVAPNRSASRLKDAKSRRPPLWGIIVAAVVVILVAAGVVGSYLYTNNNGIDGGKYQAVFFTNGQVYFGKLHTFNGDSMRLTDVYYLQSKDQADKDSKNPQETASGPGVQLIKLGQEIHGPEDEMIISKDQILFYENLKQDGKVASSIETYVNKK